jgi:hypothetical protein
MEPLQCISGGEVVSCLCGSHTDERELLFGHTGNTSAFHASVVLALMNGS